MKKKWFIAVLPVLALLLWLTPRAFADEYCALGTFPAGEALECPIAVVESEEGLEAENLPAGLEIRVRTGEEGCALYLAGTPMYAGSSQFTVWAGESITCSLDITPAVPFVSISEDLSCWVGQEAVLSVTAGTADAGMLSYQWYLEDGMNTMPLQGETGREFRPDTSAPGTWRYCCEVTNTNGELTASALSDLALLTVRAPNISSVSIETMPTRMDYEAGEDFDPTGLTLRVVYDNGVQEIVREGYDVSYDLFNTPGTHTVKISYSGFDLNVQKKEAVVSGIGVLTLPNKREYLLGESLQTKGLSIRVYTDDGEHYDVSTDLDCSPTVLRTEGEQIVTVKYEGKTCTFKVSVKDDTVLTGITVLTPPTNRSYTVGDYVDLSGLTVQLNSNKGSEILTGGYTVSPKVLASPGTQEITVRYEKYTAKFTVTVKAKESVTPTPRPTATPAPSPEGRAAPESPAVSGSPAPAVSASPSAVPVPARRNTGVNTAVKVFFAVAVLSLAGLAGYVWYLRKNGFGDEETAAPAAAPEEEAPSFYGEPVEPEMPAEPKMPPIHTVWRPEEPQAPAAPVQPAEPGKPAQPEAPVQPEQPQAPAEENKPE